MDLTAKQQSWILKHFPEVAKLLDTTIDRPSVLIYIGTSTSADRFRELKSIPEELAFNWAFFIGDDDLMFKHIKSDNWKYRWAEDIDASLYMRIIEQQKIKISKQQKEIKRLVDVVHRLEHESGKFDGMNHFSKGSKKNSGWTA